MRVQCRGVRRTYGVGVAMLMVVLAAGCGGDPQGGAPVAAARVAGQMTPSPSTTPPPVALEVPGWLPTVLPLPAGVLLTEVRAARCEVSFLAPGAAAEATSGMLAERARADGLRVGVVSSVSSTPVPVEPDDLFGGEASVVELPVTQAVVLTMADDAGTDALLTLMSTGEGAATGTYELAADSCGD